MKFEVVDENGQVVDTIDAPDEVFSVALSDGLIWEQIKAQRASKRRGTHSTLRRGEVRGGGAKPFKQKGTGRARQGSSRSPVHVGGGTVFGPKPRDYAYRLPRSARRVAMRMALSLRAGEGSIKILDVAFDKPSTQRFASILKKLNIEKALVVSSGNNESALVRSVRNLDKANHLSCAGLNVMDIVQYPNLVILRDALSSVIDRASKGREQAAAAA